MSSKNAVYPQFFNAIRIGETLKEVSSDVVHIEEQKVVGRWFHAPDEIDLFIWVDETQKIVKQQLNFYGQVVEWNAIEGTKTGVIIEQEHMDEDTGAVKASESVRFDAKAQTQPLGLAMDLIKHAHALAVEEKQQIIANFFRGQKVGGLDAEVMNSFAHWKLQRPSFFRRFYQKVRRSFW